MSHWTMTQALHHTEFHMNVKHFQNKLTVNRETNQYHTAMNLGSVSVYGVASRPSHANANGVGVPHRYDSTNQVNICK